MQPNPTEPSSESSSIYERERRDKRQKIRELGLDPYGGRTEGVAPLKQIKESYTPEMGHDAGPVVKAAGRIMLKRDMGKLSFLTLRDESGDLQVALDKKRLSEQAWTLNGLLDLGDLLVAEGPLGVTKKGEVTIWATGISVAAKALLPPPAKWEGLSDVELRYRQRYVDLWANPDVMRVLKMRMQIVQEIRSFMADRGFLEVETPMMQPLAGGAAAKPFKTHHNALDIPLYLRIAPELYLKRLLVGGFNKVFELNRNFRNEGISPRHNPEFTMLEAYEAFGSWETMAELVESMICHIAMKLFGGLKIEHKGAAGDVTRTIDLHRPWRRERMVDLVQKRSVELGTPWSFRMNGTIAKDAPLLAVRLYEHVVKRAAYHRPHLEQLVNTTNIDDLIQRGINVKQMFVIPDLESEVATGSKSAIEGGFCAFLHRLDCTSAAEQLIEVYEKLIEPTLVDPCFVTHIPSVIIPLAKKNAGDPYFADVYELAINGQEISPGYSELNDPDVQAANFAHQVGDKEEQQKVDEDFLTALQYGMPPAGGIGIGIDRLVMMLTGAESIRDVILFPLMKPQG
jgi:lysyl-tRNA synthetase class 2